MVFPQPIMPTAPSPDQIEEMTQEVDGDFSGESGPISDRLVSTGKWGQNLSKMQREFAKCYVLNGGIAAQAAIDAGFRSAHYGARLLAHAGVLAEIKRLSIINAEAKLPMLIGKAFSIVESDAFDEMKPEKQLNLLFSLMDRLGMKPKAAPMVQINDNRQDNRTVSVDGQAAQELIGRVWQNRQQRLSVIPSTMADTMEADAEALADDDAWQPDAPQGGVNSQGPVAGPDPIPPHSAEHSDV